MGRRKALIKLGAALIAIAAIVAILIASNKPAEQPEFTTLSTSTATYKLETVITAADQEKGLSGRRGLPANGGMLFKYEGGMQNRCIWMKDMKFSIDVLWLDRDNRIVSVVSGMKPSSYPQTYCGMAVAVVELPEGTVKQQALRPGQILQLR